MYLNEKANISLDPTEKKSYVMTQMKYIFHIECEIHIISFSMIFYFMMFLSHEPNEALVFVYSSNEVLDPKRLYIYIDLISKDFCIK